MSFRVVRFGVLLSSVLSCGRVDVADQQLDPRACGLTSTQLLTSEGIGALTLGITVDSLRASCVVLTDTSVEQGAEGLPERRVAVLLDQDTVYARIEDDRVGSIEVCTAHFRTDDSVGVGTTVGSLRRQQLKFLGYGEGGPFVKVARHCGLTFELNGVGRFARTLDEIPPTAFVERVLIVGCQ